jgi:anti-sigma regulatory factor (Ser/Thr protein kinase)
VSTLSPPTTAFRHEALLYAGEEGFLAGVLPFVRDAVAAGEPILVAVSAAKIELLRAALGEESAAHVHVADMSLLGANPARIIPAWRRFVDDHAAAGRRVRGIGEPVWPGRTPAEMVECQRHESLLNLAFADTPGFWLLCAYDTEALDGPVIAETRCSHPHVDEAGLRGESGGYRGLKAIAAPFDAPLPEPAERASELRFDVDTLAAVRQLTWRRAADARMSPGRTDDLVLAVNEVATNTVRHAGGEGVLRVWREGEILICEVRDGGRIEDPLVGRQCPDAGQVGGRGMWIANQLCALVQVRTFATGSVVRLHMRLG